MTSALVVWSHTASRLTHAADTGLPRTLCGKPIESAAWLRDPQQPRVVDESFIECRKCRASIERLDREAR